jgi:serine/threonine protein kinase
MDLDLFFSKANILVDQHNRARLADFGLITITSDAGNFTTVNSSVNTGTTRWMSPELLDPDHLAFEDGRRTDASDCYALGMVILEVLSCRAPFSGVSEIGVMLKVVRGEQPVRPEGVWCTGDIWKKLQECWSFHPNDRPTIGAVFGWLEHVSSTWEPAPPGDSDLKTHADTKKPFPSGLPGMSPAPPNPAGKFGHKIEWESLGAPVSAISVITSRD